MTNWYQGTEEGAERFNLAWLDAPTTNLETCGMLLNIARDQVWAYAPESTDDDDLPVEVPTETVPDRLVYAQLQQAVNLWNAGRVNSAGEAGADGYVFTPRPLDKTVRAIIRPTKGVPDVG